MRSTISSVAFLLPLTALAQTCPGGPGCLPAISTLLGNAVPANPSATDGVGRELGTVFVPASNGAITRLRFYKSPLETGAHVEHLWAADGTLLASAPYKTETASGWQSVTLAKAVGVSAGATYTVSVNTNIYFPITVAGLSTPLTSGYLSTAPGVPDGVYGVPGAQPTNSYQSSNYYVDVAFQLSTTILGTLTPAIGETTDHTPYEMGVRFVPSVSGKVSGLSFWNTPNEVGVHTGHLWTDAGTLLATITFTGEAGAGWHTAMLKTPINVAGGQTYVASVNINQFYPDTIGGLAAPGVRTEWLSTVADGRNGVYGAPGTLPQTPYSTSNYFRDIVFQPGTGSAPPPAPWHHRGYLGWLRDLASVPAPQAAYWPYIAADAQLVADYDKAAAFIRARGATEMELWGIAAAGFLNSPGYSPNVEQTADPTRVALVKQIIAKLHARGLKVVAGMGGMSWGFDQIVAANPSIACSNSPYIANPTQELAWSYQTRIIDYLMSFGVDGITVQSGDQGVCLEGNPNGLDAVRYAAPIVDRIATYVRTKYPTAIMGSANYGVSFANPADLAAVQQYTRHLDYVVDVGDTAKQGGAGYRAQLVAAIAPAELGSEADPNPVAPVHFDRLSWFLPTFQHDIANLASLYADGGRSAENYMRMLSNPSDEVSAALVFDYEAKPGSDMNANLDRELTAIYKPVNATALAQLHDIFVTGETAYFSNANSENSLVEAYYNYNDRGRPYLRDNMTASGRTAYRSALVALLAEAQAVQPNVGNSARVGDIIASIQAVIAQLDTM